MGNQQETLSEFWRYWLYGVFDGDGCFNISLRRRSGNKLSCKPCVVFTNTNLKIINAYVLVLRKLKLPYHLSCRSVEQWSPRYDVKIEGLKRVKRFCDAIEDWPTLKRVEFNILRDFVNHRLSLPQSYPVDDVQLKFIEDLKEACDRENLRDVIFDELSDKALSWLGGLVDADGTLGIYKHKRRNGLWLSARFTIYNTNKMVVDSVSRLLDLGSVRYFRHGYQPKRGKFKYQLHISSNQDMRNFLDLVGDYLVGKYDHVRLLREFLDIPGRKKNNKTYKEKVANILEKLRLLNSPGILRDYTPDILGKDDDIVQPF